MSGAPFRDSTASLLRRIEDLERANMRLRRRAHRSFSSDVGSFLRGLCRIVATILCGAGVLVGVSALGSVLVLAVTIVMAIVVGGIELLIW